MMMRATAGTVLVMMILAAGCAGPVVHVRHVISGGVPLQGDRVELRPGWFTVHGWAGEDLQRAMHDALKEPAGGPAAEAQPHGPGGQADRPGRQADILEVGGTIHVQVHDTSGTRTVRGRDPATGQPVAVAAPTLVRQVAVKVNFSLTRPGGADAPVTVEVCREYLSSEDPAAWGEWGLERADDPARVPPTDLIVRRLLGQCAGALRRLLEPAVVEADLALRPGGGPLADAGRRAAAAGDWAEARRNFQDAAARAPDDASLLFNLGAVCEAAGDLDAAHAAYAQAAKTGRDTEASHAETRTRRLIERRSQVTGRL